MEIYGQATLNTSKENIILPRPANKILRVWWSPELRRT